MSSPGAPRTIAAASQAFHYLWALQPNEQSEAEEKWQVTELAIRGVLQVY